LNKIVNNDHVGLFDLFLDPTTGRKVLIGLSLNFQTRNHLRIKVEFIELGFLNPIHRDPHL